MKHIHLIGIGGFGLSAIAQVLLDKGYVVSGSDRVVSPLFNAVTDAGAKTFIGHAPTQIEEADIVLRSSAIPDDNPEVLAALEKGIPVLKRAEFLAELTQGKQTIAIAGSHGKTTTTAMLVWTLSQLNQDPSYIVGGVLNQFASNAHAGTGHYFVIEADEYDNMFLGLSPSFGVVTNIEHDHPDFFPTEQDYFDAFKSFINRIIPDGIALLCIDDPLTQSLRNTIIDEKIKVITYGSSAHADYQADQIHLDGLKHQFTLKKHHEDGSVVDMGTIDLALPGHHNTLNATAALAIIDQLGLPVEKAINELSKFTGTQRRFEILGEVNNVIFIDDYGHHPTQLSVTITAARHQYPGRRIWAIWQPHTYTRTLAMADEFSQALELADRVLVLPVYAAREKNLGYSAAEFVENLPENKAAYSQDLTNAKDYLMAELKPNDVVIYFSAGDAIELSQSVLAEFNRKNSRSRSETHQLYMNPIDQLREKFGSKLHENVRMANFTTSRVGGNVPALLSIFTLEELTLAATLLWETETPFIVLGSGSNILVSDKGIDAIILHNRAHTIKIDSSSRTPIVFAESGAIFGTVARQSAQRGLSGLEWAAPVPGTVGGAVYGNAGAHGSDMMESLKMAEILHKNNGKQIWPVEKLAYEYRSSILKRDKVPCVILSASFAVDHSNQEVAWEKIQTFQTHRRNTQPPGASMGSTFKNPPGDFAGRLIEAAGLKGHRIGQAMISPRHANFIVNLKGASAQDIWHLIQHIQIDVMEKFSIHLEPEIELLGDFD